MSRQVAQRLPGGFFYVLAGPNPASYNLWEVTRNGDEIQLTRNRTGYVISDFGASQAGVVLADAATGLDELAKLSRHGPVFLPEGRGSGPAINAAGHVIFVTPAYDKAHPYFDLWVMRSLSAPARVAYRQQASISAAWGPHQAIAVLSGGHPPGTTGPAPHLLILTGTHVRSVPTPLKDSLSNIIWAANAPGIALTSWNGKGEILRPDGSVIRLPAGWLPAAWSPSGKRLLVYGHGHHLGPNGSIGLWSPARPQRITFIGQLPAGLEIGPFAWLTRPAGT